MSESNFSKIKQGMYFKAAGATYRKIDSLYYADVAIPDLQTAWDPMFDAKIEVPGAPTAGGESSKFVIDPQTRVVVPNPKYVSAEAAFGELWGSALFDCGPTDYEYMVEQCIKHVKKGKKSHHKKR